MKQLIYALEILSRGPGKPLSMTLSKDDFDRLYLHLQQSGQRIASIPLPHPNLVVFGIVIKSERHLQSIKEDMKRHLEYLL